MCLGADRESESLPAEQEEGTSVGLPAWKIPVDSAGAECRILLGALRPTGADARGRLLQRSAEARLQSSPRVCLSGVSKRRARGVPVYGDTRGRVVFRQAILQLVLLLRQLVRSHRRAAVGGQVGPFTHASRRDGKAIRSGSIVRARIRSRLRCPALT